MAFKCDNCNKKQSLGHRVSHAKNRSNHVFKPNIQKKKIMIDGRSVRVKLCANCIKLMRKNKESEAKAAAAAMSATA